MKRRFVVAMLFAFGCLAVPAWAGVGSGLAHDLTVAAMFQQADWVAKTVMGVLILASIATLSIWFFKVWEIVGHRRLIADTLAALSGEGGLASFSRLPDPVAAEMVQTAIRELERYPVGKRYRFAEGIKERTAAQVQRLEARQQCWRSR